MHRNSSSVFPLRIRGEDKRGDWRTAGCSFRNYDLFRPKWNHCGPCFTSSENRRVIKGHTKIIHIVQYITLHPIYYFRHCKNMIHFIPLGSKQAYLLRNDISTAEVNPQSIQRREYLRMENQSNHPSAAHLPPNVWWFGLIKGINIITLAVFLSAVLTADLALRPQDKHFKNCCWILINELVLTS